MSVKCRSELKVPTQTLSKAHHSEIDLDMDQRQTRTWRAAGVALSMDSMEGAGDSHPFNWSICSGVVCACRACAGACVLGGQVAMDVSCRLLSFTGCNLSFPVR